jgi:spore coat protein D
MFCRPRPTNILPAVVHPTKCLVNHTFSTTVVPHIHPVHTTTVNHHNFQHKHYCPQTQSAVSDVTHQQFDCCGPGMGAGPGIGGPGYGFGPGMGGPGYGAGPGMGGPGFGGGPGMGGPGFGGGPGMGGPGMGMGPGMSPGFGPGMGMGR